MKCTHLQWFSQQSGFWRLNIYSDFHWFTTGLRVSALGYHATHPILNIWHNLLLVIHCFKLLRTAPTAFWSLPTAFWRLSDCFPQFQLLPTVSDCFSSLPDCHPTASYRFPPLFEGFPPLASHRFLTDSNHLLSASWLLPAVYRLPLTDSHRLLTDSGPLQSNMVYITILRWRLSVTAALLGHFGVASTEIHIKSWYPQANTRNPFGNQHENHLKTALKPLWNQWKPLLNHRKR